MSKIGTFYINIVDPFSDTLAALGLQRMLSVLLEKQGSATDAIEFEHCGGYVQLRLDNPIDQKAIEALNEQTYIMPVPYILTDKNKKDAPPELVTAGHIEDYEERKEENTRFYEAIREGKRGHELPDKPLSWDVLRTVNPAALIGWNNIVTDWWKLRPDQPLVVRLLLNIYSQLPNPIDEATDYWKQLNKEKGWGVSELATCQQFFNPDQGKGQNRTKADAVSVSNVKGFWLAELLKMTGFYHDVLTKTVAGGKDRKIFVVSPQKMHFGDHHRVLSKFKDTVTTEASTRFDILASIRYTKALLEHYREREDTLAAILGINIKQNLVSGFRTAFYKDLGNAVATMNVSTIALPGWITVETEADVTDYLAVMDELITFTRQFEEKNSDAFTLLQHLRDFVSGDDLSAFFRLTASFPSYYMGMRERNKYATQLTTSTIERIIMSTDVRLSEVFTDGFKNIADAIRRSTVLPQYRKARGERLYEIRYGLNQELTRIAKRGKEAEFIAVLSEFIHKYNAENVRIAEIRKVQYRSNITTDDIEEIVRLVDVYGAPTIAQMLVAYGYARVPSDEQQETFDDIENQEEE